MEHLMSPHVSAVHGKRLSRRQQGMQFMAVVELEIQELYQIVNELRSTQGRMPMDIAAIRAVETSCVGHVDYAHKLALRLSELVTRES